MRSSTVSRPSPFGGSAQLGVMRGGQQLPLTSRSKRRPIRRMMSWSSRAPSPFPGAKVANLSPALADDLRLIPRREGVVIVDIANGSPAQSLASSAAISSSRSTTRRIAKTRDLERAAGQRSRLWRITIKRGGQQISVELRG